MSERKRGVTLSETKLIATLLGLHPQDLNTLQSIRIDGTGVCLTWYEVDADGRPIYDGTRYATHTEVLPTIKESDHE